MQVSARVCMCPNTLTVQVDPAFEQSNAVSVLKHHITTEVVQYTVPVAPWLQGTNALSIPGYRTQTGLIAVQRAA